MEKLKGGIYIEPKDIQIINGKSIQTARREYNLLLITLQKDKITIIDYCNYWKVDIDFTIEHLNKYR